MAISLRENKIAGRAFLIVPAVFLTGAIYFLTAFGEWGQVLSLILLSDPTRLGMVSYAEFG